MAGKERVEIGEIAADPGTKSCGFVKAGELPAADVLVPVYIINGSRPGPTLCVLAGVHSDEWPGMEAAVRIYKDIDPERLAGTIISCPYQNLPGFQGNANIGDHGVGRPNLGSNPLDGTNLSSSYPGKKDGTISERIAHIVLNQLALKADYVMDLHAGDAWEKIVPMSWYWKVGNDKVDRASEAMARAYPTDFIIVSPAGRKGSLFWECGHNGIPTVLSEAGNTGLLENWAVDFHYTGVLNVMKHFKMIDGRLEGVKPHPKVFDQVQTVSAGCGGFYTCKVDVNQAVKEGETLGEIRSIFGDLLETLVSPIDGYVFFFNAWPPVKSGDALIRVAQKKTENRGRRKS